MAESYRRIQSFDSSNFCWSSTARNSGYLTNFMKGIIYLPTSKIEQHEVKMRIVNPNTYYEMFGRTILNFIIFPFTIAPRGAESMSERFYFFLMYGLDSPRAERVYENLSLTDTKVGVPADRLCSKYKNNPPSNPPFFIGLPLTGGAVRRRVTGDSLGEGKFRVLRHPGCGQDRVPARSPHPCRSIA